MFVTIMAWVSGVHQPGSIQQCGRHCQNQMVIFSLRDCHHNWQRLDSFLQQKQQKSSQQAFLGRIDDRWWGKSNNTFFTCQSLYWWHTTISKTENLKNTIQWSNKLPNLNSALMRSQCCRARVGGGNAGNAGNVQSPTTCCEQSMMCQARRKNRSFQTSTHLQHTQSHHIDSQNCGRMWTHGPFFQKWKYSEKIRAKYYRTWFTMSSCRNILRRIKYQKYIIM